VEAVALAHGVNANRLRKWLVRQGAPEVSLQSLQHDQPSRSIRFRKQR